MSDADADRFIRDGGTENKYVARQAAKKEANQRPLSSTLAAFRPGIQTLDVVIVGAGPAGLRVAACLAEQGLKVVLVGRDAPFVNNYGVWVDEIAHLGLDDAIEREWDSCDW